jgi:hypothetical protein
MTRHNYDPRGLIEEAYKIDNISATECRAIFLDWAMSCPDTPDSRAQVAALIEAFGQDETHPMTTVLRAGLAQAAHSGRRRGGAKARRQPPET